MQKDGRGSLVGKDKRHIYREVAGTEVARNIGGHDFGRKQLRQGSLTEEYGTLGDMDAAYVLPSIQARLYTRSA